MPRKKKTETVEEKKVSDTEEKNEKTEKEAEQEKEKSELTELKIDNIESARKKHDLLIPLEEYVKAGIHLGTKIISGNMRKFVYRRRADGLAILNTNMIDERLREAIKLISKFKPEDIILVCKREAGWNAARLLSEITGIKTFTKKYPAGIITNPALQNFFEPSLVMICDPWIDKNAMHDAIIIKIPVIGLCDTNNVTKGIDLVVPCNNKSNKTLGLVFYIIAEGYCKAKKLPFKSKISDFTGEE